MQGKKSYGQEGLKPKETNFKMKLIHGTDTVKTVIVDEYFECCFEYANARFQSAQ